LDEPVVPVLGRRSLPEIFETVVEWVPIGMIDQTWNVLHVEPMTYSEHYPVREEVTPSDFDHEPSARVAGSSLDCSSLRAGSLCVDHLADFFAGEMVRRTNIPE
jgi:hypothetical protein